MNNITIIGGGIAGLATAVALKKKGIRTSLFESAPSIKAVGAGLVLAANAMKALKKIGIDQGVIEKGQLLSAMMIKDHKGRVIARTDSKSISMKYGADNFVIHRADLHSFLLSQLDTSDVITNKLARNMKRLANSIVIEFDDGSHHETDFLIAADGIDSKIRQTVAPHSMIRYSGYTCWRAVVDARDLSIDESSESWGPSTRFGIVPLSNRKIYWFACVNAPRNSPEFKQYKVHDLKKLFSNYHIPVSTILDATRDEDLIWGDIIDLKPMDQFAYNNIVLIGDAAHATTPNLGQGACQAVEDAVILADEMSGNSDFKIAFKNFEQRRIKRTHEIVDKSWMLGKIIQVDSIILASLRNWLFRMVPDRVNEKQLEKLYKVDF